MAYVARLLCVSSSVRLAVPGSLHVGTLFRRNFGRVDSCCAHSTRYVTVQRSQTYANVSQEDIAATIRTLKFFRLRVVSTSDGADHGSGAGTSAATIDAGDDADVALVRFRFWYRVTGQKLGGQRESKLPMETCTETARFRRNHGATGTEPRWLFVDTTERDSAPVPLSGRPA